MYVFRLQTTEHYMYINFVHLSIHLSVGALHPSPVPVRYINTFKLVFLFTRIFGFSNIQTNLVNIYNILNAGL